MAQEGGCLCGAIRYSVEGKPEIKALCHCLDCRKISGGTYSTNAVYPEAAFKILQGIPKQFAKTANSENKMTSFFCGDCGSTMWRQTKAFEKGLIIKVGTLDHVDALSNAEPEVELFSPRRVAWVNAIPKAFQAQNMA
ncbi:hypothetical protein P154DRAFT_486304 [Amniculicola lignicola CBS 123094]|uniref:CENP-V/GFA domain-containing protein n=1 Tax=Amniculicola lignicola CBS 123094 TaxID=1392246 RepID=A0A6A5WTY0_9PLEO|nr:hypothetical protein P154DRAFT_486304 [Amniculicola lignicola CBS 123094]